MKSNIVKDRSYQFALRIIKLGRYLRRQKEYELAGQIIRSGTSIGANVEEALAGISKPDFIAKMCVASKEARETSYWLRLVRDSAIIENKKLLSLIQEAEELKKILSSIVMTSQKKRNS